MSRREDSPGGHAQVQLSVTFGRARLEGVKTPRIVWPSDKIRDFPGEPIPATCRLRAAEPVDFVKDTLE